MFWESYLGKPLVHQMIRNDIDTNNVRYIYDVVYTPRALTFHPFHSTCTISFNFQIIDTYDKELKLKINR